MKSINWDMVQVFFLVGTMPAAIIFGAVFPSLFAHY